MPPFQDRIFNLNPHELTHATTSRVKQFVRGSIAGVSSTTGEFYHLRFSKDTGDTPSYSLPPGKSRRNRIDDSAHVEKVEESSERPKITVIPIHRKIALRHLCEKISNDERVYCTQWVMKTPGSFNFRLPISPSDQAYSGQWACVLAPLV